MKTRANADSTSGTNEGWAVMSTLIGGFVVWGGIGWSLDRWWGTHFLTPIGLIVGMSLGIYAVVARYGRTPQPVKRAVPTVSGDPVTGSTSASIREESECP